MYQQGNTNMEILIFLIFWSALIGYWASNWGRNGWIWFVVSLVISPVITAIVLLIMGKDKDTAIEAAAQQAAAIERRKNELMNTEK